MDAYQNMAVCVSHCEITVDVHTIYLVNCTPSQFYLALNVTNSISRQVKKFSFVLIFQFVKTSCTILQLILKYHINTKRKPKIEEFFLKVLKISKIF